MKKKSHSLLKDIEKPASEFLLDAGELSIDLIIEHIGSNPDILKEIPIFKWLSLGKGIIDIINTSFFIKKYSAFIGPISETIKNKDFHKIKKEIENTERAEDIIEQTIIEIERYQTVKKAKILGVLFIKTFQKKCFTIEEYNTLLFSIELMHPYLGEKTLEFFYRYTIELENTRDDFEKKKIKTKIVNIDYSPLASTCLINLPIGGSYAGAPGGARLNDLGYKFYKEIIKEIDNV